MGGYVYKWKSNEITINQEKFTINDIGLILDCNFRKAKEIKLDIIKKLNEKGINYPCTRSSKIDRETFLSYIKKYYKDKLPTKATTITNNKYTKSKEELLKQIFMNSRDIRMLLDCPINISQKIANEVKKMMESKGMQILLDHVLTKYVLIYLKNNNIKY